MLDGLSVLEVGRMVAAPGTGDPARRRSPFPGDRPQIARLCEAEIVH